MINETFAPENKQWEGKTVAEIAKARGVDDFDALCDIVVADDLMTGFGFPIRPDDDETWEIRMKVWRDGRAVIGASDAGAHLDFLATFNYSTVLLGGPVRERGLMPIEEAINLLTDVPARLYGLTERGQLQPGWHADIVVIDPETVGAQEVRMKFDLPTGRAAALRRRQRDRSRDRERHRDRRPRRVHRRPAGHVAALGA